MSPAGLNATSLFAARQVAAEFGAESARTRAPFAGTVDLEGGGTAPHPVGGGVAKGMAVQNGTTAFSVSYSLSARDRR